MCSEVLAGLVRGVFGPNILWLLQLGSLVQVLLSSVVLSQGAGIDTTLGAFFGCNLALHATHIASHAIPMIKQQTLDFRGHEAHWSHLLLVGIHAIYTIFASLVIPTQRRRHHLCVHLHLGARRHPRFMGLEKSKHLLSPWPIKLP